ncbi:FAD-dependent oxidoreductase, partial [bacterium]
GFACGEFTPCESGVEGLFLCGNLAGAKDIPESAIEGAHAAGLAASLMASGAAESFPEGPTPADWREEEPKIGVLLCECDGYNSSRADFNALKEKIASLAGVSFVETIAHACSRAGMSEARGVFAGKEPNRLILASCSERIVADMYNHMFKSMGVHEEVLGFADLRAAVMANTDDTPLSTVAAAVKSSALKGFAVQVSEVADKSVLVIGGGISGMSAALRLSSLGHPVHLVEKEKALGGLAASSRYTLGGGEPAKLAAELAAKVESNPAITLYLGARVLQAKGRVGAFKTAINAGESAVEISHGAVVLATGARENLPKIHGLGENGRVITQKQAEALLAEGKFDGKKVVMLQCAASRSQDAGSLPYCSRVCCTHALKNSLKILESAPDAEVTVLYRDLRAYGDYELAYLKARKAGVLFTAFDPENAPSVKAGSESVEVSFSEPSFGAAVYLSPDYLILSVGMAPDAEEALRLASLYGAEVDDNGFYREKNKKPATADLSVPGVYVAGTGHAPKHIGEALSQAGAAAARLSALLSSGVLRAPKNLSAVDKRLCSRCGLCVEACPYGAREIDEAGKAAVVDPILCKACGACVTVCPNKAASQYG